MIVPISLVAIGDFSELRKLFFSAKARSHVLNFGVFPSKLFEGVAQRLSILIWSRTPEAGSVHATSYRRWFEAERITLLSTTDFARVACQNMGEIIPKVGKQANELISKILGISTRVSTAIRRNGKHCLLYHRSPNNFIRSHTKPPFYQGANGETISKDHMRRLGCDNAAQRDVVVAVLMCSLFFWYWEAVGNCRNLTDVDIQEFPLQFSQELEVSLPPLVASLMKDMQLHATGKVRRQKLTGDVKYDEFYVRESKPILDEIDTVLAGHYGFTAEELDFILNYDIKYRMGKIEADDEG
jgi:hypothetical protein